ncbi:dihydrolipoyl dehydrogenase [Bordetella petrii]|nr:dihydrolipoyl dehydrogenase [Bordetella petrii]
MTIDLLVIGGGIGGYTAAIRAAKAGLSVALVEAGELGGTCLNVGCIPTKSLLHQGRVWRDAAALAGTALPALDLAAVMTRKRAAVSRLVEGVHTLIRRHRIERLRGRAEFVGPHAVRIEESGKTERFDRCVIATGSVPIVPRIPGADLPGVITSDGAMSIEALPRRLAVVGAGVLGQEFAQIFSDFGTEVVVLEARDAPLADEDADLGAAVRAAFEARGIRYELGTAVERIRAAEGSLSIEVSSGATRLAVPADMVLLAVGRRPCTDGLALDAAGVAHAHGAIETDDRCRTSVPGIWAVGDVRGGLMLAHKAAADAECAVADMLERPVHRASQVIPRAMYTTPAVAAVGCTEAQARMRYGDLLIGRFPLSANGKAITDEADAGFVKVIADAASRQIVGVSMVGAGVTELLGEATLAVQMEATLPALFETVHAHPTVSEALAEAAHDAYDRGAIHLPPKRAVSASPEHRSFPDLAEIAG